MVSFRKLISSFQLITEKKGNYKFHYDLKGLIKTYETISKNAIGKSAFIVYFFHQDRVDYASEAFKEIMGIDEKTPDDKVFLAAWKNLTNHNKLLFLLNIPALAIKIQKKVEEGTVSHFSVINQLRIRDFSNNEKVVLCKSVKFFVANRKIIGVVAVVFDVTTLNPDGNFSAYILNHKSNAIQYYSPFSKNMNYDLTNRELVLMKYLRAGLSEKQIADEMNISISTVKNHKQNIFKKLNVSNSVQAVNTHYSKEE